MKVTLLRDRRFWPLFWTQFLGALNDNAFKNALVILITFRSCSVGNLSPKHLVALCGGIFILPFFAFSASAGVLADKISKSRLVGWIKACEVMVMILGAFGFITGNLTILIVTLFLMGLHSTFFGPVKYSILPQLMREHELVSATAYVEMGTFLAILTGTTLGGFLISSSASGPWLVSGTVLATALLGWVVSMAIQPLAPVSPSLELQANPIPPTVEILRLAHQNRPVFLSILGISWFWFFGAAVLSILPAYCGEFLKGDKSLITIFLTLFSLGVGAGSMLCSRLSVDKLELGLVPVGSVGISVFALDLFLMGRPDWLPSGTQELLTMTKLLSNPGGWRMTADFFLMALFGGLFIVPLYTLIQKRSEEGERSRVIAGNNILNSLFMVFAAALLVLLFSLNLPLPQIFLVLSLLNLAVAVYIYTLLPEFLLRFGCWLLAHVMYRVSVIGCEHLPRSGPAVLVCNHVSYVDWLIVASACPRPLRFIMHHSFFQLPFVRKIFRDAKVIPIAGSLEDRTILAEAFDRVALELEAGELVCIFPEGRLSLDGSIRKFRPGIETIIERTPVPVIPVALCGLWGSFFSKKDGKPMRHPFRRIWSRISLVIGPAIHPDDVTAAKLEEIVRGLKSGKPL